MPANDPIIERLFAAAVEAGKWHSRERLEVEIAEFGTLLIQKCHDWRNHVPDAVADEWDDLPLVAKLVAFIPAASLARQEEWD